MKTFIRLVLALLLLLGVNVLVSLPFAALEYLHPEWEFERWYLLLMQGVASICTFVGSALLYAWWFEREEPQQVLPILPVPSKTLWIALLGFICAMPTVGLINIWNQGITLPESMNALQTLMRSLEDKSAELTKIMVAGTSLGDLLINLLVVAVIAAVGEEMFFRGIIQCSLQRVIGGHLAVWITAAVFSFVHFQFFGFFPRMLLGILLGYAALWTGSLRTSIVLHCCNNGLAVIGYWVANRLGIDMEQADSIQDTALLDQIAPCLVFFCFTCMAAHYLRTHSASAAANSRANA